MASIIKLKSGVGDAVPAALKQGEVAINVEKGLFYYGSGSGDVRKPLDTVLNLTASISGGVGGHISASGNIFASTFYMDEQAGTDNSVVVLSGGKLVTDEIDAGVWGASGEVLTANAEVEAANLTAGIATLSNTCKTVRRNTNALHYPIFVTDNNSSATAEALYTPTTGLTFNPGTEELAVSHITSSGNLHVQTDITSSGHIRGKQLQLYCANWKGDRGTTETFIPLAGVPDEQTAGIKEMNTIIMPTTGTIKEIILRMHWTSTITTSDDITWRIYLRTKNKKMNTTSTASTSFTMVNPLQDNDDTGNTRSSGELTQAFAAGDALAISMEWASTGPTNAADRIYVTVVVEHDWNTTAY